MRIIDVVKEIDFELKNKYEIDSPIDIKEYQKNEIQFTKFNYSIKNIYKRC